MFRSLAARLWPSLLAIGVAIAARPASAQDYTFQTLDAPGSASTYICWMNNRGVVTQQYVNAAGVTLTAIRNGDGGNDGQANDPHVESGRWTVIQVPGATFTGGTNATESGVVALTYAGSYNVYHGALWKDGSITYLKDIPGYQTGIQGINDHGQLAANVVDAHGAPHGLTGNSTLTHYRIFDAPGSVGTIPFGINNAGTIVGVDLLADGTWHGFAADDGRFLRLDLPGAPDTELGAINARGDVVGDYWTALGAYPQGFHGLLYRSGVFVTVDVPHATGTAPYFINDQGQISGVYAGSDGVAHGFVATPNHGRE